jgi:hypothetical protein
MVSRVSPQGMKKDMCARVQARHACSIASTGRQLSTAEDPEITDTEKNVERTT